MGTKKQGKQIVKCRLVRNKTATADKAPWLVKVPMEGTTSVDDLARCVHEKYPNVDEITMRSFINAFNEVVIKKLKENPCTEIDLGYGTLKPVVEGSAKTIQEANEKIRKKEIHAKYIIVPSNKMKKAIKDANLELVPINSPDAKISIRGVTTDSLGRAGVNAISAGVAFKVTGVGFSADEPSYLTVELTDSAGAVHAVEVTKVSPDVLDCVAPAALANGKARLVLAQALGPEAIDGRVTAARNLTVV